MEVLGLAVHAVQKEALSTYTHIPLLTPYLAHLSLGSYFPLGGCLWLCGFGQLNHFILISLGLGFSLDNGMIGPSDLYVPSLLYHIINPRLHTTLFFSTLSPFLGVSSCSGHGFPKTKKI